MTDVPTSGTESTSRPDRAAAIARAKAAQGEPTASRTTRRGATASRILVAGAATSSGLLMVGAMAGAAGAAHESAPSSAPQVVERVVVIEVPTAIAADATATPVGSTEPAPEVTVVREVRVIPAPAQNPAPAPAPSQGS